TITSEAMVSPAVSQTLLMMGISQMPAIAASPSDRHSVAGQDTVWPTFQKKLMRVTAAPQITAAAQDTRTPILPREARWGLELLEPKPHTIALISSARTDRMRATVITAPTMVRSAAIPGSPE